MSTHRMGVQTIPPPRPKAPCCPSATPREPRPPNPPHAHLTSIVPRDQSTRSTPPQSPPPLPRRVRARAPLQITPYQRCACRFSWKQLLLRHISGLPLRNPTAANRSCDSRDANDHSPFLF